MNLILLGAPGAGKGTQAELLIEQLNIPSISTGNMLREAMANGSELGKEVKYCMENGLLVSDELVLNLLAQRVAEPDCTNGFILPYLLFLISPGILCNDASASEPPVPSQSPEPRQPR